MNSNNDKEGSGHVKAAIIGGIFVVIAACITGGFLLLNTMVENGVIVFGMSNPSTPPTATVYVNQEPTTVSTNSPISVSTSESPNTQNSSDDKWACIQEADSTQKSTWETCWRFIQIDNAGIITEATKESANAIEWIGPTDLSYTTIGQYHSDYISEWYAWALQNKPVRFCIDIDSKAQVEGKVESISAGCYLWQRGAFMVEIP